MTADELTLRLATLVEHPTQVTETLWGPKLDADSEAGTALARWHRDHTGGDAA